MKWLIHALLLTVGIQAHAADSWQDSECQRLLLNHKAEIVTSIENKILNTEFGIFDDDLGDYLDHQEDGFFPKPSLEELLNLPQKVTVVGNLKNLVRFRIERKGESLQLLILLGGRSVKTVTLSPNPTVFLKSGYLFFLDALPADRRPEGYMSHLLRISQAITYPLVEGRDEPKLGLSFSLKPKFKPGTREMEPAIGDEQIEHMELVQFIPPEYTNNSTEVFTDSENGGEDEVGIRMLLELKAVR